MSHDFSVEGIWTALVTPFDEHKNIDWECFKKLLKKQEIARVQGVVINGTTGESTALSSAEKLQLVKTARDYLPREIQIMAGTGSSNTRDSVEHSRLAAEAGANALLIVTPPYVKPTVNGLVGHFVEISKASDLPICLYHVPSRTGLKLPLKGIEAILNIPKVSSIKEASGCVDYFSKVRMLSQQSIKVLSGDDGTFLPSLSVGGDGCISVVSNVFPEAVVAMHYAFKNRNQGFALCIHQALSKFTDMMFVESNPGPVKFALSKLGLCQNILRLPLAPVEIDNEQRIEDELNSSQQQLIKLGLQ